MARLLYFAYGSNLYSPRLRFRVPTCRVAATASLSDHRLIFHKQSIDGSAKCDAIADTGQETLGVIYEIDGAELLSLRSAEGVGNGYGESTVKVRDRQGEEVPCLIYLAASSHINATLLPYTWYHDFVLRGCREHGFPDAYVSRFVLAVRAIEDPKPSRGRERRTEVKGNPANLIS
jgi:hypothetical protein